MTPQEIVAIEKFAKGLKECFESRKKECKGDNPIEKTSLMTLNYATDIIDLHLELANLNFNLEAAKEANG